MTFPDWPSFPLYVRNVLTSRAVARMSPAGRGGYLFLLCHAWISERPGWLRDDDQELAALSGLGEAEWQSNSSAIRKAFKVRKGWLVQVFMVSLKRDLLHIRRGKVRAQTLSVASRKSKQDKQSRRQVAQQLRRDCGAVAEQLPSIAVAVEAKSKEEKSKSVSASDRRPVKGRATPATRDEVARQIAEYESHGYIRRNATSGEWEAGPAADQPTNAEPSRAPSPQTGTLEPTEPPTDDFSLSRSGQVNGMVPIAEVVPEVIRQAHAAEAPPTQEQIAEELRRARK